MPLSLGLEAAEHELELGGVDRAIQHRQTGHRGLGSTFGVLEPTGAEQVKGERGVATRQPAVIAGIGESVPGLQVLTFPLVRPAGREQETGHDLTRPRAGQRRLGIVVQTVDGVPRLLGERQRFVDLSLHPDAAGQSRLAQLGQRGFSGRGEAHRCGTIRVVRLVRAAEREQRTSPPALALAEQPIIALGLLGAHDPRRPAPRSQRQSSSRRMASAIRAAVGAGGRPSSTDGDPTGGLSGHLVSAVRGAGLRRTEGVSSADYCRLTWGQPCGSSGRALAVQLGKRAGLVSIVGLLITVGLGLGITQLKFATGQDAYLNKGDQVYKDNVQYQGLFGGEAMVVLFTMDKGKHVEDLFTPANIAAQEAATKEIKAKIKASGEKGAEAPPVVSPLTALQFSDNLVQRSFDDPTSSKPATDPTETIAGQLLLRTIDQGGRRPQGQKARGAYLLATNARLSADQAPATGTSPTRTG